jgi:predicted Zn-dependent peptidase
VLRLILEVKMKENIQTTRLPSGLTIITEKMPDVRSATLGFWLKTGSRHEPKHLNGICHFIEHAVFKGTNGRTALDIAIETDRLGGNLDAFTSHETTGFMIKVVDEKIPQAFDLIADMITSPRFDEKELKRERRVIFEEMKMVEDAPEDLLSELFLREFFPAHALGLPIEGTRKTVKTFNQKTVSDFHAENYSPGNIVIACAGNVEHQQIVDLAEKFFHSSPLSVNLKHSVSAAKPNFAAPILLEKKPNLEQTHLIIAAPWIAANDERRYAGSLLNSVLGDGNSSRLWQNVREKRGLAYSVGASVSSFEDCGIFSIYAGTSPEKLVEVVDLSIAEIRQIKRKGVSAELNLAKEQTVSAVLLGLESTSVRADALAQSEIIFGRQISVEETLEQIENVNTQQVQEIANEFFQTDKIALAALGNLNGLKIDRETLNVS